MLDPPRLEPIDYLLVGHLARDLTSEGSRVGGTASYAGLTAHALGMRVGIVTSWGGEIPLTPLEEIPIVNLEAEHSTAFNNLTLPSGRLQSIHQRAADLDLYLVPDLWRRAPIVHLAPIAQEVPPSMLRHFPDALLGLTLQGWLRDWDEGGRVRQGDWPEADYVLRRADAAVLSIEDLDGDQAQVDALAAACPILVVTQGSDETLLHWQGEVQVFLPPETEEVSSVGAGDIFAAAFFVRLHLTNDPVDAVKFANRIASRSVNRRGLESAPTRDQIYDLMAEAF